MSAGLLTQIRDIKRLFFKCFLRKTGHLLYVLDNNMSIQVTHIFDGFYLLTKRTGKKRAKINV